MTALATSPYTDTHHVLLDMFTENTGRHFLDSGGAYGRAWERNQGTTVEQWMSAPGARIDSGEFISVNTFQYLAARLEYDPVLDARLQAFGRKKSREWKSYMQDAEDFVHDYLAPLVGVTDVQTINTYNFDNALDQTLQWVEYRDLDTREVVVLLQYHGGCDVRGGYTKPRAFRSTQDDGFAYDCNDFMFGHDYTPPQDVQLPGLDMPDPGHWVDHRSGDLCDNFGNSTIQSDLWPDGMFQTDDDGTVFVPCPYGECTQRLSVYAPESY